MTFKLLGVALLATLVVAAPSLGSPQPITATALAAGAMQATTIHAKTGSMVFESIKIAPGGSFGWHTHGSPVAVVVQSGTLTVLDPTVQKCEPFTVSKGQAFVEPANHPHLARNDTSTPVTVYALYLGVGKSDANEGAKVPAGCHR